MGNLLGSPVTEKETYVGVTKDERLRYGLSSMQGWRVHMEDAHIAEGNLYALPKGEATVERALPDGSKQMPPTPKKRKIELPGHALFAVYDGHGGTFAANYSGNNFLRVLSKQPKFVEYAKMVTSQTAADRGAKMEALEMALKQAFVETDYEIALAIRGKSHPDSNTPYHDPAETVEVATTGTAGEGATGTTTVSTSSEVAAAATAQLGTAAHMMRAASDHLSAIEDEGDSGTTACVVLVTPDSIVCANAGDSRAIYARRRPATAVVGEKAIPLSFDHKPDDDEEERRIRAAGGYVANGRVEGDLAVSRGLGDFRFKQMAIVLNNTQLYPTEEDKEEEEYLAAVAAEAKAREESKKSEENSDAGDNATMDDDASGPTGMATDDEDDGKESTIIMPPGKQKVSPIPDVTVHIRNAEQDEYIAVCCDGIWDVLSNQQFVVELDAIMYAEGERDLGLISEEILDTCLRYGSKDNMTAVVVQLPGCEKSYADAKARAAASVPTPTEQNGVMGRRRIRQQQEEEKSAGNSANEAGFAQGGYGMQDDGNGGLSS